MKDILAVTRILIMRGAYYLRFMAMCMSGMM